MGKNPAQKEKKETEVKGKSSGRREKKAPKKKKAVEVVAHSAKSCQVKGCKRRYRAKKYCKFHYTQWRHGAFGAARYKRCHDASCQKPMAMNRHGFCEEHYQSYYVKGVEVAKPAAAPAPTKAEPKPAVA